MTEHLVAEGHPQRKHRPRRNADGVKVYRVQAALPDFGGNYTLTVPASVARLIGPDAEFALEVTDDGLLYRKVSGDTRVSELPAWLR